MPRTHCVTQPGNDNSPAEINTAMLRRKLHTSFRRSLQAPVLQMNKTAGQRQNQVWFDGGKRQQRSGQDQPSATHGKTSPCDQRGNQQAEVLQVDPLQGGHAGQRQGHRKKLLHRRQTPLHEVQPHGHADSG